MYTIIKNFAINSFDALKLKHARRCEIKKFQDPRRVDIFSKVVLSDEQKSDIDELYKNNYGEKIPYIWHRHYTAFTGKFDKYYFPELLYIPEFERFMNESYNDYYKTFEDKNILALLANAAGVKMPETIFKSSVGIIQTSDNKIITKDGLLKELSGQYFIKPTVDTCSGVGCQVVDVENGYDKMTNTTISQIIESKGENWVIQERLKCHQSIATIYPDGVNTFRIMTYIWQDKICHCPVIMRIGQGGQYLDNVHAGGIFVAISDDGTLHSTAFTEFKKEFTTHPDTKIKFENYKINLFPNVLAAAEKCHSMLPQIGCINWDFTIEEDGNPVLIEANIRGSGIGSSQMAHGCGRFGEKTPEILRWMRFMKNLPKTERYKYPYGKIK
jgi:hypothetical protein